MPSAMRIAMATYSAAFPATFPVTVPSTMPTIGMPISKALKSTVTRSRSGRARPPMPSAAATANVSRPRGTTRAMSVIHIGHD